MFEVDLQHAHAGRNLDVKRFDLHRVALPGEATFAGADHEAGQLRHVAPGAVFARDQQREPARRDRQPSESEPSLRCSSSAMPH